MGIEMPERPTLHRVEALLETAQRGEADLAAFWQDDWLIGIEGADAEIREDVLAAGDVTLVEAMLAARTIRDGRAARRILRQRYRAGCPEGSGHA